MVATPTRAGGGAMVVDVEGFRTLPMSVQFPRKVAVLVHVNKPLLVLITSTHRLDIVAYGSVLHYMEHRQSFMIGITHDSEILKVPWKIAMARLSASILAIYCSRSNVVWRCRDVQHSNSSMMTQQWRRKEQLRCNLMFQRLTSRRTLPLQCSTGMDGLCCVSPPICCCCCAVCSHQRVVASVFFVFVLLMCALSPSAGAIVIASALDPRWGRCRAMARLARLVPSPPELL